MRVLRDDTGLVGLRNVSEDHVDHADQEAVVLGLPGIVDDGDDVGALLGHVHQVPSHSVRELNRVDNARRAHDIRNMGDSGSGGSTEVEDSSARHNSGLRDTANNRSSDLGAVGVPNTIFYLLAIDLDADAFLVVDGFAGD